MLALGAANAALSFVLPGTPTAPGLLRAQLQMQEGAVAVEPATSVERPHTAGPLGDTDLPFDFFEARKVLKATSKDVAAAASREHVLRQQIADLHEKCATLAADKAVLSNVHLGAWKARCAAIEAEVEALEAERALVAEKLANAYPPKQPVDESVTEALAEAAARAEEAEGYPDEPLAITWTEVEERYAERTQYLASLDATEGSLRFAAAELEAKSARLEAEVNALEKAMVASLQADAQNQAKGNGLVELEAAIRRANARESTAKAAVTKLWQQLSAVNAEKMSLQASILELRGASTQSPAADVTVGDESAVRQAFEAEKRELSASLVAMRRERDEASSSLLAFQSRSTPALLAYCFKRDGAVPAFKALAAALASFVVASMGGVLAGIVGGLKVACTKLASPFLSLPAPRASSASSLSTASGSTLASA